MRLREHFRFPGLPLSVSRCQANAYFLTDSTDGSGWILKRFKGRCPDEDYLESVGRLLPNQPAFLAGTARRLLSSKDVKRSRGHFFSGGLRAFIEQTVLMPQVNGCDWANLAKSIREGRRNLGPAERLKLCRLLSQAIVELEKKRCAHRDLSCGNVLVDLDSSAIHLIDFDCLFHPTLKMPEPTTIGTDGYIAPFVLSDGRPETSKTWHPNSDRFSLSILLVEILTSEQGDLGKEDEAMFSQKELRSRSGRTLEQAATRLREDWPGAFALFDAAMKSGSYEDCPSPEAWVQFCGKMKVVMSLSHKAMAPIEDDFFRRALKHRPGASTDSTIAKRLKRKFMRLPTSALTLPEDPWRN